MRPILTTLVFCALASAPAFAQAPASGTAAPPAANPAPPLPVRRVILYKTGVGYFEHLGNVVNRQDVTIAFTSAQLNDVLKSLTALDLGKGRIASINYNSNAPLEQRMGALRLPLDQRASSLDLLGTLRGARVEVSSETGGAQGRLLSVERQTRTKADETRPVSEFSIITDSGELRTFELTPSVRIRVVERDLRQEIGRYLDLVGSIREQDVRSMTISSVGSGERSLFVSYISEVPIWKSTYRLVLPKKPSKPLLQGWAIVDNTTGSDWTSIELSLVAGAPQSFVQEISQPYYGQRPVVPLPANILRTPQTHQPTLESGGGTIVGRALDNSGSALPGVRVTLTGSNGYQTAAVTDADGEYEIAAPAGEYTMKFELEGFQTVLRNQVALDPSSETDVDVTLEVGSLTETLTVTAEAPTIQTSTARRFGSGGGRGGGAGIAAGVGGGVYRAPMPHVTYEQFKDIAPAATAGDMGDLFEYRITEPVTLAKNQSALVPIVNTEIEAERVSLWNRSSGSGRPLRAVWLTNASGLTLDGGTIAIVDENAFAGEGLIEPLKPGEKRLVSYASDLGVLVGVRTGGSPMRVTRVRARDGILIQDSEERATWTYSARNEDATARTLVIEHPTRDGWKLDAGQAPAEATATTQRFRMNVDSKREGSLVVRDIRIGETSVQLTEVTDALVAQISARGIPLEALQKVLRPVLDKKSELAGYERQLRDLSGVQKAIGQDQQRLRENMKALRGSAEEKQLLQRYTRQLDQQEDQLAEISKSLADTSTRIDTARGELSKLVASLSFDIGDARLELANQIHRTGRRRHAAGRLDGDRHRDRLRQILRCVEHVADITRGVRRQQPRADRRLRGHHPQLIDASRGQWRQIRGREDHPARPAPECAGRGLRRNRLTGEVDARHVRRRQHRDRCQRARCRSLRIRQLTLGRIGARARVAQLVLEHADASAQLARVDRQSKRQHERSGRGQPWDERGRRSRPRGGLARRHRRGEHTRTQGRRGIFLRDGLTESLKDRRLELRTIVVSGSVHHPLASSDSRSLITAWRILVFTVPSGSDSRSAISAWVNPS